jgi:hypothetical protein
MGTEGGDINANLAGVMHDDIAVAGLAADRLFDLVVRAFEGAEERAIGMAGCFQTAWQSGWDKVGPRPQKKQKVSA